MVVEMVPAAAVVPVPARVEMVAMVPLLQPGRAVRVRTPVAAVAAAAAAPQAQALTVALAMPAAAAVPAVLLMVVVQVAPVAHPLRLHY